MSLPTEIAEYIRAEVARQRVRSIAGGSIASVIDSSHVNIIFDGSATAQSVRILGDAIANAGERAVLVLVDDEWICIGTKTPHPDQARYLGETYRSAGTATTYTTETVFVYHTVTGLAAGQQVHIEIGHVEYSVSDSANEAELRIRAQAGSTLTTGGTEVQRKSVGKQTIKTPMGGMSGVFTVPSAGTWSFGLTFVVWTGVAPGVTLHATFGSSSFARVWAV